METRVEHNYLDPSSISVLSGHQVLPRKGGCGTPAAACEGGALGTQHRGRNNIRVSVMLGPGQRLEVL